MEGKIKYNPAVHHRKSIRLKGYDYSKDGFYFITICTHNRESLFGQIIDRKMILNTAGKIADEYWLKIPEHFPNAILHEHVVMPNHVHGIIELTNFPGEQNAGVQNAGVQNVGVQNFEPLPTIRQDDDKRPRNEFQKIIPRSIGSIIRGYKIGVTKYFRDNSDIHNVWQRNFHDHIIRDEQSYRKISEYIKNNPKVWREDKFYRDENVNGVRGSKF